MKYLLILLLSASCAAPIPHNTETQTRGIDLRKYAKEGFLFTTEPYNGNYDFLGVINLTIWPEVKKFKTRPDGYRRINTTGGYNWYMENVNVQAPIDQVYHLARSWEADAIMNFGTREVERRNADFTEYGVEVYGNAIKRK